MQIVVIVNIVNTTIVATLLLNADATHGTQSVLLMISFSLILFVCDWHTIRLTVCLTICTYSCKCISSLGPNLNNEFELGWVCILVILQSKCLSGNLLRCDGIYPSWYLRSNAASILYPIYIFSYSNLQFIVCFLFIFSNWLTLRSFVLAMVMVIMINIVSLPDHPINSMKVYGPPQYRLSNSTIVFFFFLCDIRWWLLHWFICFASFIAYT